MASYGTYHTGDQLQPIQGLSDLEADVAQLMVKVLRRPETVRHTVGVAY
jgi:hypothetical protein